MELRKTFQAIFITIIFILASFQAAYAIGEDFTYDANGNMIYGPDGLYYEYNYANQLKRVREGGPTGEVIAVYWYDHTGKRKKKNESGVVTYYWFDDFEQIYYPNGTIVNITYYSANNERLAKKVSTASGDKMYYFHPDHLGSTSIVSDEAGNLVEKTEYYPYGGVKQGGGEQYLFTGKELDKGTGLYYYGARYYSPELMRFTQPDSIIQDAYDPQSLNRYAYVRNNPLKYTDPTGNVRELRIKLTSKAEEKNRIGDAMATRNDPRSAQEKYYDHYDKLLLDAESSIDVHWLKAAIYTIVSPFKILKKTKYEKPAGLVDSIFNQDEAYLFSLGLKEEIEKAKKAGSDYDAVDDWIEEHDGARFNVYSYEDWYNYHGSSYTRPRRSGGGCNYCNTPGYEGYWAPPSWVDNGYDPETGTWPD